MSYKIKKVSKVDRNIITEVEFVLSNGDIKTLQIPHYLPNSSEDVIRGIENREVSENRELEIPVMLERIKSEVEDLIVE